MNQLAVHLILGAVLGLALAAQIPDVPHADVALSGGPQGGSVRSGENFLLRCDYNSSYPGVDKEETYQWTPHIEFWHNQDLLGAYERKWSQVMAF